MAFRGKYPLYLKSKERDMFKKIFLGLILLMSFLAISGCVENISDVNTILKEIKRDTDQDGVSNDKDKCPETTEGMEVDMEGCP